MEDGTSIDDILSGNEPEPQAEAAPEPVAEPIAEPQAEPEAQAEGQPRGPDGKFIAKDTGVEQPQAEAAAPPAADKLPPQEFAALKDERRKRQALEQQIADLNARFETMQRQQPQAPEPDFWDNPQGVIASQVQRAVMEALQAEKQQATMARINESEERAKAAHADYEDAFLAFQQAAQANPSLIQQMTNAGDPADFAYKTGKAAIDLQRVGSIDELLKAKRAEWEAEARAAVAPAQTFPASTVTERSVGSRTGPAWSGPASINDILSA